MEGLLPKPSTSSTSEHLRRRFVPPDGGYGWFVVFAAFFAHFWITGLIKSFGVLLLEIFTVFEGSSIALGAWIPAILATFTLCLSPVTGALVERFSSRSVAFAGSILCCAGLVVSCFVTQIEHLLVTIGVVSGLGAGLALLPGFIITSQYFVKRRALASGICVSGTAAGSIVLPRFIQLLVPEFGLRGTFLLLGGGVLQVCVCAALMRPIEVHQLIVENDAKRKKLKGDREIRKVEVEEGMVENEKNNVQVQNEVLHNCVENNSNGVAGVLANDGRTQASPGYMGKNGLAEDLTSEVKAVENTSSKKKSFLKSFDFSLLKNTTFLLCATTVGLMAVCNPHFLFYMPSYITNELGLSKTDAATLVSVCAGVDMFGRIAGGWLADRQFISLGKMYSICFILSAIPPLCLPFVSGMPLLAVLSGCFGLATGCWFLLVPVILTDYHGVENISSSYGLVRLFQGVMTFCSPLVIGAIFRATNSYDAAFFMMSACLFVGALLMLMLEPWTLRHESDKLKLIR